MGIKQAKIYSRTRLSLETVIPRKAPFSIQIDLCSLCNMKCQFCFHSDEKAVKASGVKLGIMSFYVFVKIIDDMKNAWGGTNEVKKLKLFAIGESLINPQISQMIRYAKDANVAEGIELTTNGTLLSPTLNNNLIDAGLDIINISVNGLNAEQYLDKCGIKLDFDAFVSNIKHFYENRKQCRVQIKLSDTGFSPEEIEKFYKIFESNCNELFAETISSVMWQDTDINEKVAYVDKGIYGQEINYKYVCPFLFTTMVINSQGVAHMCCLDWKMGHLLGDLKYEKIDDIWNGKKLKELQKVHLRKRRSDIKLCKDCESPMISTTDNIDEYADKILSKLYEE